MHPALIVQKEVGDPPTQHISKSNRAPMLVVKYFAYKPTETAAMPGGAA